MTFDRHEAIWNAIQAADGCAEYVSDGCDVDVGERGLLLASWSYVENGDRLRGLAERAGFETAHRDDVSTCSECYKAVATAPDGWDWQPSYVVGDGFLACSDCVSADPSIALDSEDITRDALPAPVGDVIDWQAAGYVNIQPERERWNPSESEFRGDLPEGIACVITHDGRGFSAYAKCADVLEFLRKPGDEDSTERRMIDALESHIEILSE